MVKVVMEFTTLGNNFREPYPFPCGHDRSYMTTVTDLGRQFGQDKTYVCSMNDGPARLLLEALLDRKTMSGTETFVNFTTD